MMQFGATKVYNCEVDFYSKRCCLPIFIEVYSLIIQCIFEIKFLLAQIWVGPWSMLLPFRSADGMKRTEQQCDSNTAVTVM